jgi:hypothetical protein
MGYHPAAASTVFDTWGTLKKLLSWSQAVPMTPNALMTSSTLYCFRMSRPFPLACQNWCLYAFTRAHQKNHCPHILRFNPPLSVVKKKIVQLKRNVSQNLSLNSVLLRWFIACCEITMMIFVCDFYGRWRWFVALPWSLAFHIDFSSIPCSWSTRSGFLDLKWRNHNFCHYVSN